MGKKDETINWAWTEADRDNVTYAAHDNAASTAVAGTA
jgi:hypothetical protein